MKEHLNNIDFTRRQAIKGLLVLGASLFFANPLQATSKEKSTNFHFIGLGGVGSNLAYYFFQNGAKGRFSYVNSRALNYLPVDFNFVEFIPPGSSYFTDRLKSQRISDMSQPINIPSAIWDLTRDNEYIVLLSGLGGYTGSFLTEKLTLKLDFQSKDFLSITSLPFSFESAQANKVALETINKLNGIRNFRFFDINSIRLEYGNMPVYKAFELAKRCMFDMYLSTIEKNWQFPAPPNNQ